MKKMADTQANGCFVSA